MYASSMITTGNVGIGTTPTFTFDVASSTRNIADINVLSNTTYGSFGQTWTTISGPPTATWNGVALSATGQYQTAVYGSYSAASGVYYSNNYGSTWSAVTIPTSQQYQTVAMSASGQYQVTGVNGNGGKIYVSTDYGVTWAVVASSYTGLWNGFAMSSTGQYMVGVLYYYSSFVGTIYYSSDYGVTWTQSTGLSSNSLLFTGVCCSGSGQYQTACANGSGLWYSSNYGASWTLSTSSGARVWVGACCSLSGQYQSACVLNGSIYYSSDYGVTWTSSGVANTAWQDICCDSTAQYQLCTVSTGKIWYSTNYGQSWTVSNSASTTWARPRMSRYGQYSIANVNNGTLYSSNLSSVNQPFLRLGCGSSGNQTGIILNTWNARPGGPSCQIMSMDDGGFSSHMAFFSAASGSAGYTVSTERMRITANGLVGIGTAVPANLLTVSQLGANYSSPVLVIDAGIPGNTSAGAPRGIGRPLLGIGNSSWTGGGVAGDYYGIGFGWGGGTSGSYYPAEIGLYVQTTSGNTYGDMVFSTRPNTTMTVASERMRITSAGNVGIGTAAPVAILDLYGSFRILNKPYVALTSGTGIEFVYDAGGNMTCGTRAAGGALTTANMNYTAASHNFYIGAQAATSAMFIGTTGNVSIGTTVTQNNMLRVFGGNSNSGISLGDFQATAGVKYIGITAESDGTIVSTSSGFAGITWGAARDGGTSCYMAFHTHGYGVSSGERMRIDKDGRVGIGTVTPVGQLSVVLNGTAVGNTVSWGGGHVVFGPGAGNIYGDGVAITYNTASAAGAIICLTPSVSWRLMAYYALQHDFYVGGTRYGYVNSSGFVNVSDEREKINIKEINTSRSLERILSCVPKTFQRVMDRNDPMIPDEVKNKWNIGLIAQEVMSINPHCISESVNQNGEMRYGINYTDFVPHLIGSVKELSKIIADQDARIKALEAKLAAQ
jgi:hypothetical protein